MTLLETVLSEIKTVDEHTQIKILCDRIQSEEEEKDKKNLYIYEFKPEGPNIYLSLLVPGKMKKQISFLTLEREFNGYICRLYNIVEKEKINPVHYWVIAESKPEKVITEYAKRYKFLKGE